MGVQRRGVQHGRDLMRNFFRRSTALSVLLVTLPITSVADGGTPILRCIDPRGRIAEYAMHCSTNLRSEDTRIRNLRVAKISAATISRRSVHNSPAAGPQKNAGSEPPDAKDKKADDGASHVCQSCAEGGEERVVFRRRG